MDDLRHEIEAALAESRAELESDGMLSLFYTDDPEAWPDASIDIPQLAGAILPLIAKVRA